MQRGHLFAVVSSTIVLACGEDPGADRPDAAIPDARPADAGPPDAASSPDASPDAMAPAPDATPSPDGAAQTLDPLIIPQFVTPLPEPAVMAAESRTPGRTIYRIAARQIEQQVLPDGFPPSTVWAYGRAGDPASFGYPARTVEARRGERVRVTWINGLVDAAGRHLPHLFAVDQTLHWANPADPLMGTPTQEPYLGPVPIVTHVHGAHVASISDGHPDAWYLPAAATIPSGWHTRGPRYGSVAASGEGEAVFEYTNDQRATTLWYHDHALGITRLNVQAGLAGFWIIRDDVEDGLGLPGPAPAAGEPPGTRHFEIPIVIQDRRFLDDGTLVYPTSREEFDGYDGPFAPETDVPPIWNPEAFGDVIVVNGRTWPYLDVEPRLYRFRLLNGTNARFLILELSRAGMRFQMIGNEGGLRPLAPLALDRLLVGPAERFDVLVDFSDVPPGETVTLLNLGPDEPFKGTDSPEAPPPSDPRTTGRVMRFRVVPATGAGTPGAVPAALPPIAALSAATVTRELTLNELVNEEADIPVAALLGTVEQGALEYQDAITETPLQGATEIWRISNLTADAHPIHLHLVMFEVLDRTELDAEGFAEDQEEWLETGSGPPPRIDEFLLSAPVPAEVWEAGRKDTVIVNPGETLRVAATFDLAGQYVWHCHILEHEDNEMMRRYEVLPP